MFSRTMRNAPRSMRFLSTRSAASNTTTAASRKNLYLGTVAATAGLAAYGYTSVFGDRARVWNEDLKVNRHKVAAAQGKTPDTPLNNEATTANSLHIDTSDPAQQAAGGITAKPSSESSSTSGKEPKVLKDKAEQAKNEENSEGQSAYNEETGEINWDCPCLGGMADGPCGEDFKAAFSCFVHSDAEPKGLDCVEKFKAMQDCFRKHPDIYGEEIDDDQEEGTSVNETRVKVDENASADTKQPKKPTDDHPDTPQKLDTGLTNPSKMGTRGPGGIASSSGR